MIVSELYDLKQYLTDKCKCNVGIGQQDLGSNQYPFIQILIDDNTELFHSNNKLNTIDFTTSLKIQVDKDNEIKAFEILERLILNIDNFNSQSGHYVVNIAPDYVDEIYEINVSYVLKIIIQNTN